MYCKRGLDCVRLKTSCDLKNLLKGTIYSRKLVSHVKICVNNKSHGNLLNVRWKSYHVGVANCLCQNKNIHTMCFPSCCPNTEQFNSTCLDGKPSETNIDDICEKPVPYDVLASKLRECSSIAEQMEELTRILSLTPDDLKRREQLCLQIRDMLSPYFKDSKVQMYGSSVNGFGFKGCDVDMSFFIVGDNRKLIISNFDDPDVPSVYDVLDGRVSIEDIAKLPQREQLLFIHTVFAEYYKDTSENILFLNAFVPIVRFYHDRYGLKCDLSFRNSVAFRNTKLLKLCRHLDERVEPLMMAIRYWAKHVGLIGGGLTFNTYTISLLVMFFLQTRNPPVLPTVEYLLSLSDYLKNEDMDDNTYLEDLKKVPPSENKQTTVELLKEFFFYYAYFDYNLVICPLTGVAASRMEIHSQNKTFKMNTICVQDPIKLSHNVSGIVLYTSCRLLFMKLLTAVTLFHEENILIPTSTNWGLLSLYENSSQVPALSDYDCVVPFKVDGHPSVVHERNSHNEMDEQAKQQWIKKISQAVLNVLEYALLFECRVEELSSKYKYKNQQGHILEMTEPAQGSFDLTKNLSGCKEEPNFTINCVAYNNTWLGRDDMKAKICPSDLLCDPLETEHSVSVKLVDQRRSEAKKELFSFRCEGFMQDSEGSASLLIKFKPVHYAEFNPILGLFLNKYMPKIVNSVLRSADVQDKVKNAVNIF